MLGYIIIFFSCGYCCCLKIPEKNWPLGESNREEKWAPELCLLHKETTVLAPLPATVATVREILLGPSALFHAAINIYLAATLCWTLCILGFKDE